MMTIEMRTVIRAPIETCFELALDVDLEVRAAREYHIQSVAGASSGRIGLGERVTWTSKQFGIAVRHTSEITLLRKPLFFQDKMVTGVFRSFEHDHFFREVGDGTTEMKDMLRFAMPFYALGMLSEKIIIEQRLKTLLKARNEMIKRCAEDGAAGKPS